MSLLSAHHVSQANALIHSAYLPSICLHYNYARIIGALISPPLHFWHFYFRIPRASRGFRLVVLSAPENALLHEHGSCATPTAPRGGGNKAAIVLHAREVINVVEGGRRRGERQERTGLRCQTVSAPTISSGVVV